MGTKQNTTTYIRCDKDEQHPFNRISAKLNLLDGYQLAIMVQILSNNDGWNLVKYEIKNRLSFPRGKFNTAWKSLIALGYIKVRNIQSGYAYTIYEDPDSSSTADGICQNSTSTTGTTCAGGTLTTINNNYYNKVTTAAGSTCDDDQYNELLRLYPDNGTKPDGTTYPLKRKRNDSKKAYIDYLKAGAMTHDEIIKALTVELNEKQMTGNTYFQQGLLRWISDKTFEQFKGRSIEPIETGYGESLA